MTDIPIVFPYDNMNHRDVSNGHLAVSFFEVFLWEDVIEVKEVREKIVRLGQMAQLVIQGLKGYEAQIAIFASQINEGCQETESDVELVRALKSIACIKNGATAE